MIDKFEAREARCLLKKRLTDEWKIIKDECYNDSLHQSSKTSQYIMKLFGWDEQYGTNYERAVTVESIKPEVYKKLLLLTGENGYCLLKAMEARMK